MLFLKEKLDFNNFWLFQDCGIVSTQSESLQPYKKCIYSATVT